MTVGEKVPNRNTYVKINFFTEVSRSKNRKRKQDDGVPPWLTAQPRGRTQRRDARMPKPFGPHERTIEVAAMLLTPSRGRPIARSVADGVGGGDEKKCCNRLGTLTRPNFFTTEKSI